MSKPNTRRSLAKAQTRAKILAAATKLLLAHGEAEFSMRKLAAKIGYTPTAIYFHFPDRQSLLGEVVETRFIALRQAFERIGKVTDPVQRLAKLAHAFIEFGLEHPDHYRFMFLGSSFHTIPKGRLIEKGNPAQDCYAFLRATVCEALAARRFRSEYSDADQIAQIIFAAVHGVMALHIVKGEDDWIEWRPIRPKAKRMIEAVLRGLTNGATVDARFRARTRQAFSGKPANAVAASSRLSLRERAR